jgi:hypothetical protein
MYERRPPPQTTSYEERIQSWVRALLLPAILLFGGWALIRELDTPPSMTAMPPATSATSSPPASPFVVQFPDTITLITHTPEPTMEPTPTYAVLPPPPAIDICFTATPKGAVCTQPMAPQPSPTPILPCPVKPDEPCIAQGGSVRHLPTPTPIMGYGSTN